ncbi:hypothetical protein [Pimelobacter simplex]|uniref:hypothetical protein n=1 Tax=Nocardioides simplex TaxID=2045 RepID=UPI003AB0D95C
MTHWSILRQVVLGVEDVEVAAKELREELGLGAGFEDPMLADIGLADHTIRVGPVAHLELVAPLHADVSIAQWLAKGGGPGGYCLSIQVSDVDERAAAAERLGIRLVADLPVDGHRVVQLHPADMGLLVELDGIADPDVWFWDAIEVPGPAAPQVVDVLAVEMSSPDPQAQAERWSAVFDVPLEEVDGTPQLRLGERVVRFVAGERRTFTAVDLAAAPGVAPRTVQLSGVEVRVR